MTDHLSLPPPVRNKKASHTSPRMQRIYQTRATRFSLGSEASNSYVREEERQEDVHDHQPD